MSGEKIENFIVKDKKGNRKKVSTHSFCYKLGKVKQLIKLLQ